MGEEKGIIVLVFLIILMQLSGCVEKETEEWGREGDLEIRISLSASTIGINDTVDCTLNLTNVGETRIRFPYLGFRIKIFNEATEDEIEYLIDDDYRDPIIDERDLKILSPGETYLKTYHVNKDNWAIEKGAMHIVNGSFNSHESNIIEKPYWIGKLHTDQVTFLVHPYMD